MAYTTIPPTGDAPGLALLVIDVVGCALAAVAIALRVWAKRIKNKALGLDDGLLFVGWIFTLGIMAAQVMTVVAGGLGQHMEVVTPESLVLTFKSLPIAESCWAVGNTAIRVSILLMYKQIFSVKSFRIASDIVMAIVIMLGIGSLIQALAICRPFEFQWDKTIPGGVCGNQNLGILLVAFLNLFTDLALVFLPMPLLWQLKMPKAKKIALTVIFGLGILICTITIFRIVFTFTLIANTDDSTYWIAIAGVFICLEPNLGIVNACLPHLKPLIPHLQAKFGSSSGTAARSQTYALNAYGYSRDRRSKFNPSHKYGIDIGDTKNFTRLDDSREGSDTETERGTEFRMIHGGKEEGIGAQRTRDSFSRMALNSEGRRTTVGQGDAPTHLPPEHDIAVVTTLELDVQQTSPPNGPAEEEIGVGR